MISTCLTYNQLLAYSAHKVNTIEREHLYMHISNCELCTCAVNGFTASPFELNELVAIHRKIDSKANATAANPLTLAQCLIVFISIALIFAVYKIADHKTMSTDIIDKNELVINQKSLKNEKKNSSETEISSAAETIKKIVSVIRHQKNIRRITFEERLELIQPIQLTNGINQNIVFFKETIPPYYNPDGIYIYDLKVSGYDGLYLNHSRFGVVSDKNHVPAMKENEKNNEGVYEDRGHFIPADKVLRKGLAAFNKQNFTIALDNFNLLLNHNPDDVNAQFYVALSYYNLDSLSRSADYFKKVMKNENNAFYPEAQ
jgi:hypothetical protein